MAGLEEEIIIIEDTDAATTTDGSSKETQAAQENSSPANKKKILVIVAGVSALLIAIAVGAYFLLKKPPQDSEGTSTKNIEEKLSKPTEEPVEPSKIENLIAKADYLYSTGSKSEALSLYEKIAHYSEAVSAYNLGVAQIKEAQYATALASFAKAIQNNEKRCVSAINAAVCSLHLNDEKSFRYYIDLAHAYLPQERQSPLYSYYYTLTNYYNQNYLEALSSLNNPTTKEYANIQNSLSAKINALFGNNIKAIESLEKNHSQNDDFSLGILYARVGDLPLAKKHLQNAIKQGIEPMKAQLAIGYVNLKSGQIQEAAKEIENVTDLFAQEVYKPYPIKVKLQDSLFKTDEAQKHYRNFVSNSAATNYQKIFYFSPYKIFNANQTISYIRKGNATIFIDNLDAAKEYLQKSASSSNVNLGIVQAIKKALSHKLREANEMLQKLVEIQPKHSALHYNLGLTYAQMGNFVEAHKHFLRSYNLDAKNYISGIYAVMCAQLTDKESAKLLSIIKDEIANEAPSEETDLLKTLLFVAEDNFFAASDWLEKDYQQRSLYLALDIIIALKQKNSGVAQKSANKLIALLPNEILPHMMYIDAFFNASEDKKYALDVINHLKIQEFSYQDLYFGAHIARYLFIQQYLISGKLYFLREQLKDALASSTSQIADLTSALALASLYDGAFEESYTLYNDLIDNHKIRDSHTLFLGAVASIAANHHENAIALLELSKMKDSNFLESRYALGLLYMEAKNNEGAVIQLSRINKNNFFSEYFDFTIDTDKVMFERNQRLSNGN
ncbi:MAG: tetratricopeptide repeat protein [Sulfurimonas sp.]|uniref:tetratricopeptide repeat protein n=1 Tax=Sulfurimonas sp. TaxID=2022749 RepID=UPI00263497CE|nr:tetratricopeptide repeat protein [Sulfurimonas sp.]MDD2651713.1 tetratricopeptide repeat protein [Sulfurimonas sp.]MDD3451735.1 tetratricopeptide repeat protein [Sulfurimonas sp.]